MCDLISRQAAIDAMFAGMPGLMFNDVLRILRTLPTAQPERKTGRWLPLPDPYGFFDTIPVCSECGCTTKMREKTPFCPNCGARMDTDGE